MPLRLFISKAKVHVPGKSKAKRCIAASLFRQGVPGESRRPASRPHAIVRRQLTPEEVVQEVKRFEHALVRTRQQITEVQRRVADTMSSSEADIFDAHLLMLEDRVLIEEVIKIIRSKRPMRTTPSTPRRAATFRAGNGGGRISAGARADLRDLASRVLDNLLNVKQQLDLRHLTEPCIW